MKLKLWKIAVGVALPVVPISTGLVFATVQNASSAKNESLFANWVKNPEELKVFLAQEDGDSLAVKAQNSDSYRNWIMQFNQSDLEKPLSTAREIEDLDMDLSLRAFLLQNYLEKVDTYEQANTFEKTQINENGIGPSSKIQVALTDYTGGSGGGYYPPPPPRPKPPALTSPYNSYLQYRDNDGTHRVTNAYNNYIYTSGKDGVLRNYNTFADDTTHFYFSNQTVFDYAYELLGSQMSNEFKIETESFIDSVGKQAFDKLSKELWSDSYKEDIYNATSNALKKKYLDTMEKVFRKMNSNFKKFNFIQKSGATILGTSLLKMALGFSDGGFPSSFNEFKNKASEMATDLMIPVLKTVSSKLASKFIFAAAGPIASMVVDGLVLLLSFIPSGNGHSIMSNFDDHGLNDWEYQWSSNKENMILNMVNWSNDYRSGMIYKVSDGWFYTPRLEIWTQGKNNHRIISGTNISSNDFNWGKKIKVYHP